MPPGTLPAPSLSLAELPRHPLFQYGEQLLRAGYFWEAHAVWEELWRTAPGERERTALRSFIQLAAAYLKAALGNPEGEAKLLARARRNPLPSALAERFEALARP